MPEEEAFSVLVSLMYNYGLRDLYKHGFESLYMRLYQLNRLMKVNCTFYLQNLINFNCSYLLIRINYPDSMSILSGLVLKPTCLPVNGF